jgi:hypothetical protein
LKASGQLPFRVNVKRGDSTGTESSKVGTIVCETVKVHSRSHHTTGGGTGTAVVSFTVVLPSGSKCNFSTSGGTGTYNPTETTEGGDLLTITKQPLTVTPIACGTTATISGSFTMETDLETTVPVYLM